MKKQILIGILFVILLIGCTSKVSKYTPENLVNKALQETEEQTSFYAEGELKMFEEDQLISNLYMQEWHGADGKLKLEYKEKEDQAQTITVYDGDKMMVYSEEDNEAFVIRDTELFSMHQPSLKEQADVLLETISETHTVEVVGEDTVAGYQTHHLKAIPNENDILLGEQDIWIDKNNWMVLKQRVHSGDMQLEIEYQTVDYEKKMSEELFTIDLPDSVKIQDDSDLAGQSITLNEAISEMEQSMSYFPENEQLNIKDITLQEFDGLREVTFNYEHNDLPFIELVISELTVGLNDDLSTGDDDVIEIRGENAHYYDDDIRMLDWDEGGLNYSIFISDPGVSLKDVKQMTEEMIDLKQ